MATNEELPAAKRRKLFAALPAESIAVQRFGVGDHVFVSSMGGLKFDIIDAAYNTSSKCFVYALSVRQEETDLPKGVILSPDVSMKLTVDETHLKKVKPTWTKKIVWINASDTEPTVGDKNNAMHSKIWGDTLVRLNDLLHTLQCTGRDIRLASDILSSYQLRFWSSERPLSGLAPRVALTDGEGETS